MASQGNTWVVTSEAEATDEAGAGGHHGAISGER